MSKESQDIVIDQEVTEAIAKTVNAENEAKFNELTEKMEKFLAENAKEEVVVDKGARGGEEAEVVEGYAALTKEQFAKEQIVAKFTDRAKFKEMNDFAVKSLQKAGKIEKATYLNVGTDVDGGYLVPENELMTDVLNILPEFSSFAGELRVVTLTQGEGIDVATLTADVVMTEVGTEGGAKTATKVTFGDDQTNVREFAGIALMTKKLVAMSASDVYAILRDSYARAIAKNREELALTDATSGIINKSGIVTVSTGGTSLTDTTWEIIKSLPYQVPTQSANGGIYVISRALMAHLDGLTGTDGHEIMVMDSGSAGTLTGRFRNGYRFVVAETLPNADAVSTEYAVFGNFGKYAIDVRLGAVQTDIFDSGIVTISGTDHNLIQENKLAMRVETWENVGYPLTGAFAVLTTDAS